MQILCVRVAKGKVGVTFPFDRVYLAKYEDRAVFEALFRYALVLPIEGELKTMVHELEIDEVVTREMERDDEEETARAPKRGEWKRLFSRSEWVMAVPILPRFFRDAGHSMPKYLAAARWYGLKAGRNRKDREVFASRSFLQTPEKKIRPICVVCPRFIEHQAGECQLGQKVCYSSLGLGKLDYFAEGLSIPDAPLTPKDEELLAAKEPQKELVQLGGV